MRVLDLLKRLVSIPSVNPMGRPLSGPEYLETRVGEFLIGYLRDLDVEPIVQRVAPGRANVFAIAGEVSAARTILLDAHQDTVPVDGMTIAPFDPVERDGRLYGRGACDVKGGLAAMLAAFTRLVRERPSGAARVILSCTVDEESTSTGIDALTDWWRQADCPLPKPDWAVIAEPTELDVVVAHRGATRWKIRTAGRACHSSSPDQGINAIYRMARVVERLEFYAGNLSQRIAPHPLCGPPTCSVGRIGGGVSVNTVPDDCWIEIDRRIIPGEDSDAVIEEVRAELASLPFAIDHDPPWIRGPALPDDANGALAQRLGEVIREVVGPRGAVGVPYGTHASRTAVAGIPSVVFGPGSIAQAHTVDEWIDIAQLEQACDIYYRFCVAAGGLSARGDSRG